MIGALLRAYGRSVQAVAAATLWLCVAALIVAVGLDAWEIVARYFFGSSSLYRVELSVELCTALYLIGYLVLLARGEDVTMDYFHERLPARVRVVLDVLIAAGVVWFFAVLLDASVAYFRLTRLMTHPTFPISRGVTTMPIVVAAAGGLWVAVYRLLDALHDVGRRWRAPAVASEDAS